MSKPNLYDGAEVYGRSDNMKKTLLLFTLFFLCFSLFAASYNKMLKEWNSLSEDEFSILTELSPNGSSQNAGQTRLRQSNTAIIFLYI